jgi:hypothetical protein
MDFFCILACPCATFRVPSALGQVGSRLLVTCVSEDTPRHAALSPSSKLTSLECREARTYLRDVCRLSSSDVSLVYLISPHDPARVSPTFSLSQSIYLSLSEARPPPPAHHPPPPIPLSTLRRLSTPLDSDRALLSTSSGCTPRCRSLAPTFCGRGTCGSSS